MDNAKPDTTLSSIVGQDHDKKTLLDYLCARFRYRDRPGWQAEIALRRLSVNGRTVAATHPVRFKDTVSYTAPRHEPEVATDLPVLFEDEFLLVVAKPGIAAPVKRPPGSMVGMLSFSNLPHTMNFWLKV